MRDLQVRPGFSFMVLTGRSQGQGNAPIGRSGMSCCMLGFWATGRSIYELLLRRKQDFAKLPSLCAGTEHNKNLKALPNRAAAPGADGSFNETANPLKIRAHITDAVHFFCAPAGRGGIRLRRVGNRPIEPSNPCSIHSRHYGGTDPRSVA